MAWASKQVNEWIVGEWVKIVLYIWICIEYQTSVHVKMIKYEYQNNIHIFDIIIRIILGMDLANDGRRYSATSSLIGRAHSQNYPWSLFPLFSHFQHTKI